MAKTKHKEAPMPGFKLPAYFWPVVIILFVVSLIAFNLPEEEKVIDFAKNVGEWQVPKGVNVSVEGDKIRLTRIGNDFFLVLPNLLVDANQYDVCQIELKSPVAYDAGRMLFISQFNQRFDYNFGYDFDTGQANRFNKITINLSNHPAWLGYIRAILLLPGKDSASIELNRIRFVRSNILSKGIAFWSDFVRYYDPKLGSCFAMASPRFILNTYHYDLAPILWWSIALIVLILLVIQFFKSTRGVFIGKTIIILLLLGFYANWGILEIRNGIFYLKGIRRNVSLYWGKSQNEKRGIVVGDRMFVDFMAFCDQNIPDKAKIFSLVSAEPPGTPPQYLHGVQFGYLIRPRFTSLFNSPDEVVKPYYVVYYSDPQKLNGLDNERSVFDNYVNDYLELQPGQTLAQEYILGNRIEDISSMKIHVQGMSELALSILNADKQNAVGMAKLDTINSQEAIFKINGIPNYLKSAICFNITNMGINPIKIGISKENTYLPGRLFFGDQEKKGDLTFDLYYSIKSPKLFKKFSDSAYIMTR